MYRFRGLAVLVLSLALHGLLGLFCSVGLAEDKRPNVIVILTDDQGWGDLSCHGNVNIATPNIDKLASLGTRFDRFYVCPVCAPTRAEFLTGRYHPRGGVSGVTRGEERLNVDERTIAHYFKAGGYSTAAFGKWHNGMQYPYHPLARGFDEFYGYCSGHWGDYFSPQLERNGELVQGDGYLVDDFTNNALRFIEQNAEQPFFLYLPMPTPHSPMQVPDQYWEKFRDKPLALLGVEPEKEDKDFTRAALAMVECIDTNVGRILGKLDELELANDTIVVFFCDNGPNSDRWNGGMKGRKGSTDEGGVRSPLFISWPGKIPAGKLVPQISSVIDLLPTLGELANVPVDTGKPIDGQSLVPLISGATSAIPERMIFSHWKGKVSVRTQQFRLDHHGNLYDMVLDPGQMRSINAKWPKIRRDLQTYVEKWKTDVGAGTDNVRPFSVGHRDFGLTQLPARDGQAFGSIERSASAPNCSYFRNWRTAADRIVWDVDVLHSGNFDISMYYACPDSDVGTEIILTLGDTTSRATIEKGNTPSPVGPEHDRVKRKTQSPMKDFVPLHFRNVRLESGSGELSLAARKPGGEETDLEMRLLMIRRVP